MLPHQEVPPRAIVPKTSRVVQKLRSAIQRSPARLRQHLIDQGPLLGVGVLARDDIDDQHGGRVEDHQRLPRQGRGAGGPRRPGAVLGAGQVVAVEDLGAVARHGLGQVGVELIDQRGEPPGIVPDEGATDARLQPLQLLVQRRQRGGDLVERGEVGGADRGLGAADDEAISSTIEEKSISRVYWRVAFSSKRRSISAGSRVCSTGCGT